VSSVCFQRLDPEYKTLSSLKKLPNVLYFWRKSVWRDVRMNFKLFCLITVGKLQGKWPVMDINRKASGCIVRLLVYLLVGLCSIELEFNAGEIK
jgi:hypothetical protein